MSKRDDYTTMVGDIMGRINSAFTKTKEGMDKIYENSIYRIEEEMNNLNEDDVNSLFEDREYEDDSFLFESEEADSSEKGIYMGSETIDGVTYQYHMLEEGEYSEELATTLKNFRTNRAEIANNVVENAILEQFMEASNPQQASAPKTKRQSSNPRGRKHINAEDKEISYTDKNGKKVSYTKKKTDPKGIIDTLKNRSAVKKILAYNRRLKRKLQKFMQADKSDFDNKFRASLQRNIDWIYDSFEAVMKGLGASAGSASNIQKTLEGAMKELKGGATGKYRFAKKGDMSDMVKDLISGAVDVSDSTVERAFELMDSGVDSMKMMANTEPSKAQQAVISGFIMEAFEPATDIKETLEKMQINTTHMTSKGKGKRKIAGVKPLEDLAKAMGEHGTGILASLVYGKTHGKYSLKFFVKVNKMAAELGIPQTNKDLQGINAIREGRALAGKLAHDFKWVALFNKYGLLGSKISITSKKKNDNNSKMHNETVTLVGSKAFQKWIKSNSKKISQLLDITVPKSYWGMHRQGGKLHPSESSMKQQDKKAGMDAKKRALFEDDYSYDDIAFLVELM